MGWTFGTREDNVGIQKKKFNRSRYRSASELLTGRLLKEKQDIDHLGMEWL